jgi:choline dehydrogenase-like flavoprotein
MTEPQVHLNNQRMRWVRGRMIGGSGSINGNIFARGDPAEYDSWRDQGCQGWAYADLLPYFKRLENCPDGDSAVRGQSGPIHCTKMTSYEELSEAYLAACTQAGYERRPDYNDGNYEGEEPAEPASASVIGDYPEALSGVRHYPTGRLQTFQRHRARVWGIYDHSFGKVGDLTASGLWRFESGRPYSLTTRQLLTGVQEDLLADYVDQPEDQQVFYSERGFETFPSHALFDVSYRYRQAFHADSLSFSQFSAGVGVGF